MMPRIIPAMKPPVLTRLTHANTRTTTPQIACSFGRAYIRTAAKRMIVPHVRPSRLKIRENPRGRSRKTRAPTTTRMPDARLRANADTGRGKGPITAAPHGGDHDRPQHLDLLIAVHPLLEQVHGDGFVPLPATRERLEEFEHRRRIEVRDERGDGPEAQAVVLVLLLELLRDVVCRPEDRLVVRGLHQVRRVLVLLLAPHRP